MFRIHPSMDECWINEMDVCVNVCMSESWCCSQFRFLCNQEVLHSSVFTMQEKKEDAEVHMLLFYFFLQSYDHIDVCYACSIYQAK